MSTPVELVCEIVLYFYYPLRLEMAVSAKQVGLSPAKRAESGPVFLKWNVFLILLPFLLRVAKHQAPVASCV